MSGSFLTFGQMMTGALRPTVRVLVWPKKSSTPGRGIKPSPTGHIATLFKLGDEVVGYSSHAPAKGGAPFKIGSSVLSFSVGGGEQKKHPIYWRYPFIRRQLEDDVVTYGHEPYEVEFKPSLLNLIEIGKLLQTPNYAIHTGAMFGPPTLEQGYILASAELEPTSAISGSGTSILPANQCITESGRILTSGTSGLPMDIIRLICEKIPSARRQNSLTFGVGLRSVEEALDQISQLEEVLSEHAPDEGFFPETK